MAKHYLYLTPTPSPHTRRLQRLQITVYKWGTLSIQYSNTDHIYFSTISHTVDSQVL